MRTKTGTQVTADQRLASSSRPRRLSPRPKRRCATPRSISPTPRSSRRSPAAIGRAAVSPGNLVSPDFGRARDRRRPSSPMGACSRSRSASSWKPRKLGGTGGDGLIVQLRLADGQPLQGEGQARLHRRRGRSQDRRPDRARGLRQQEQRADRRPDGARGARDREAAVGGGGLRKQRSRSTRAAPTSSWSTTRTWSSRSRVKVGTSRDGLLAVEDGLKAGEKVIIQGQQRVRAGMTVKRRATAPAAPSTPNRWPS